MSDLNCKVIKIFKKLKPTNGAGKSLKINSPLSLLIKFCRHFIFQKKALDFTDFQFNMGSFLVILKGKLMFVETFLKMFFKRYI